MLDSLYFWKNKGGGTSGYRFLPYIIILFVLCAGGAGAWYYFVILPEQKAREEALARQQAAAQKMKNDIASVNDFYAKSLEGAGIKETIRFLSEIRISSQKLSVLNLESEAFKCNTKSCSFSYEFRPGNVLILPQKIFWGKNYNASVPAAKGKGKGKSKSASDFEYKNIESRLNINDIQKNYKNKKFLNLPPCGELVSYILTYNSFVKSKAPKSNSNNDKIVIKKMPGSSVKDLESQLVGKVKAYGLMAGSWELTVNNKSDLIAESIMDLQLVLYKQAYRDAFIVKGIETSKKGIKVSGGLVCKV
ncbi:CfcF putative [Salmonella enterica subsp. salamae]|nr:CfcF putative [Salmonella enterica subsp. salamae]